MKPETLQPIKDYLQPNKNDFMRNSQARNSVYRGGAQSGIEIDGFGSGAKGRHSLLQDA